MKRGVLFAMEALGVLLVMAGLWFFLARWYSLKPYSDPQIWYLFAKNFPAEFGTTGRAYGFPLIMYLASLLVGPFWSFLVNIPLLCAMAAMLYLLTRVCANSGTPGQPVQGALSGAIALAILVAIDMPLLLYLANPYRDPLAFLLMMASMTCVAVFVRARPYRLVWVIAGAVLLALGIGTRDTVVLMGLPYAVFMVAAWRRDRALPFWKAALFGGVAFALAFAPQAWQNHLVSGHSIIPAQAAELAQESGSLTPGVRQDFFADTFPRTVAFFWRHYSWGLSALFLAGLVYGVRRRSLAVNALLLPGVVVYFGFYAGYKIVMARYLFVVDLLAIPVMAIGATWILAGMVGLLLRKKPVAWVGPAGVLAVLIGVSLFVAFGKPDRHNERFRIRHAVSFREDIDSLVPEGALILGDRPLAEIVRCFSARDGMVVDYVTPLRTLGDQGYFVHLREEAGPARPLYLLCRREYYVDFLRRQKDVSMVREFASGDYGMQDVLNRDTFSLYRLSDWTGSVSRVNIPVRSAGTYVLAVDTCDLSSFTNRLHTALSVKGRVMDEHPMDGWNYYPVRVRSGETAVHVSLTSDRPVPASLRGALVNLDEFVFDLGFVTERDAAFGHLSRFGGEFVAPPWPQTRYMGIFSNGTITVPTMEPGRDVCFAVRLTAGLASEFATNACPFRLLAGTQTVFQTRLELYPGQFSGSWQDIACMLDDAAVTGQSTMLRFEAGPYDAGRRYENLVMLRRLLAKRFMAGDRIEIVVGAPEHDWYIMDGMYPAERDPRPGGPGWRWTQERSRILVPLRRGRNSTALTVRYLLEGRPPTMAPASPEFRWNGEVITGTVSTGMTGSARCADVRFDIPADRSSRQINTLEIRTSTWVPNDHGLGNDKRTLGIMLHSVSAIRQ